MDGSPRDRTEGETPGRGRAAGTQLTGDERRELLLLYANDVILLFDEQYRVADFNDRALEAYGYSREEFRGLTLGDLREGSQPIALDERMAEVRRRGGMVFESINRRKDGSTFPVETSVRVVTTSAGQYYHTIVRDISERRAAEHELRETLHRMKQAERLASLGHWRVDLPGGQFRPSDELLQIVGASHPPVAMFGEEAESYVHPDDRGKREKILEALRDGQPVRYAWRALRPDGEIRYLEGSAEPVFDDAGRVVSVFGVTQDVTERAETTAALRQSEERVRGVFATMMEGFAYCRMLYDEEGRRDDFEYLEVNPAFAELTGIEGAAGRRVTELIPSIKDLNPELLDIYGEVAETGMPAEFDIDFAPLDKWLHVSATRPREGEFVAVFYDITERLEMERALRQSEAAALETVARLSRSQQLGRMGDWEWDVASGEVRWSEEIRRIYGVGHDFVTSFETIVPMTHPADAEANLRGAQAILDDPDRSSGVLTFRIVRPDGAVRHVFQTLAVDRTPEGEPVRVFGIMQDVTELRETELALLQSERRFRRFYDASLVGVAFWTAEGSITDANDRFLDMLGYTREDLYAGAVDWAAMTPPEYAARDEEALEELQATGRNAVPYEKDYYTKDGARLPVLITAAALDEEATSGILLVLDVTEQKRAELDLRRLNLDLEDRVRRRTADLEAANKELESFSYSVSHDLRAPLRHIAGFAELLRGSVGDHDDEDTGHFIDVITHAANDMGILIDDLLQFSRVGRAEMHIAPVDMEQLVREVLDVAGSDLGDRRVEVTVGEIVPAPGDRTLLRQVWANLIGNAYKYSRPRDPAVIEIGSRQDDGEVVYWVRDNGVGFDLQYAERLFHVFERLHHSDEFEGTGIGLANVQRIVGRHDGRCWAEAEEGNGATFFFSLPNG